MKNLCLLLAWLTLPAYAAHLRGGYLQAQRTSATALTYTVTVRLSMDPAFNATAITNEVQVCFGDGTTGLAIRTGRQVLAQDRSTEVSTYQVTHTYAGPGTYRLLAILPNRTTAQNLPQANSTNLGLSTTLLVSAAVGPNTTPVVGVPENGFRTGVNQPALIALRATDPDGDSLSYGLARPLQGTAGTCQTFPATTYAFPNDVTREGTFRIDARTGDLRWNAPTRTGQYAVAVNVVEWRRGVRLGETLYELMITVEDRGGPPTTLPPYEPATESGNVVTSVENGTTALVELTAYPVPMPDYVHVRLRTATPSRPSVELMDARGRIRCETTFTTLADQHATTFDTRQLAPGVYFLRANGAGRPVVQKVIKQ